MNSRRLIELVDPARPVTYGILKPGPDLPEGVPYVRVVDIRDGKVLHDQVRRTSAEIAHQYRRSTLEPGDLLMSIRGHVGRMAFVPRELRGANITQDTARLALTGCEPRYVRWFLASPTAQRWMAEHTKGVAVRGINLGDVKELPVPLPPLSEQRRIAAILDKADAIRRKRQETIRLTEEFLRSAFLDMFGDPVTNPKGWPVVLLEDAAEIASGVTKGRKLGGRETVMVPYMRVANVQDMRIDLTDVQEIEVLPGDVEKYRLEPGDVLLTEGGDPDKLGRGAVWDGSIDPCIHQNHIFRVRPDRRRVLSDYLATYIASPVGKTYFLRAAKQTTGIATINKTQLRSLPVLVPDIDKQKLFSRVVKSHRQVVGRMGCRTDQVEALSSAVTQRAFKGELWEPRKGGSTDGLQK